jgi:hypothetical protein
VFSEKGYDPVRGARGWSLGFFLPSLPAAASPPGRGRHPKPVFAHGFGHPPAAVRLQSSRGYPPPHPSRKYAF